MAANLLESNLSTESIRELIKAQGKRWWNIHIQASQTKRHFLEYVGRYLRDPPIAEHRITKVTEREVEFWTKDSRSQQLVKKCVSIKDFLSLLSDHVPDRYRHAVRYYGLLAPRSIAKLSGAIFALLGQQKRHRPRLLRWRRLHQLCLKRDPLIDRCGQCMRWVGRLEPYVPPGGSG